MDVLLNVALSDDHSGSPLSLGPGGSAQGSLLSPWHCLLSLWCFRFSPSPIHVSFCFHNLGDLPCKSVLHKRPCKIFTPSPWNFPSCPRQSTHLSLLLLSFTFVCLPPPSLFFSAFTGSVGPCLQWPTSSLQVHLHKSVWTPKLSLSFPVPFMCSCHHTVPSQLISVFCWWWFVFIFFFSSKAASSLALHALGKSCIPT